jgi:hypothetical protein
MWIIAVGPVQIQDHDQAIAVKQAHELLDGLSVASAAVFLLHIGVAVPTGFVERHPHGVDVPCLHAVTDAWSFGPSKTSQPAIAPIGPNAGVLAGRAVHAV